MNNQQFRRLVLEQSGAGAGESNGGSSSSSRSTSTRPLGSATPALGSRQRPSIGMTPRVINGQSGAAELFRRQLQQQRQGHEPPAKKFKASAAPKGTKLAHGYQDRSKLLRDQADEVSPEGTADDRAKRVKALEEQFKLGQIEQGLFEKLRDEIVGGDVQHVHLVKGLDWRLLERVRRGEDVYQQPQDTAQASGQEQTEEVDVDAEFEQMEHAAVAPLRQEEKSYAQDMPSAPAPAKKRTRDDILREMKAARAKESDAVPKVSAQQLSLGPKFRRVGAEQPNTSRVEINDKGREVLIVVDGQGNVKRKVRKGKPGNDEAKHTKNGLLMPDKDAVPLGMDVPDRTGPMKVAEEDDDEDGDIFAGAGADYDPLGIATGEEDESGGSESEGEMTSVKGERLGEQKRAAGKVRGSRSRSLSTPTSESRSDSETSSRSRSRSRSHSPIPNKQQQPKSTSNSKASAVEPSKASAPRNYFSTPTEPASNIQNASTNPLSDPSMLAALRRAAALSRSGSGEDGSEAARAVAAKEARHAAMLASATSNRDLDDMDLGFGESRLDDGEDDGDRDGKGVRLAEWKGRGVEGEEHNGKADRKSGGGPRKRGKKKGKTGKDANNVRDVLSAIERRKGT